MAFQITLDDLKKIEAEIHEKYIEIARKRISNSPEALF